MFFALNLTPLGTLFTCELTLLRVLLMIEPQTQNLLLELRALSGHASFVLDAGKEGFLLQSCTLLRRVALMLNASKKNFLLALGCCSLSEVNAE
ncbi:hypothetical protein BE18_46230 [Sorangium cellulosum]|uniref:Uncharacterized protein n=1 Tax=Sorangium cellulosum TaxID=56 RepID=A0A150RH83_SORCE|nr:hypothetical protein BE18_46230 [Sorangium cellulosum]